MWGAAKTSLRRFGETLRRQILTIFLSRSGRSLRATASIRGQNGIGPTYKRRLWKYLCSSRWPFFPRRWWWAFIACSERSRLAIDLDWQRRAEAVADRRHRRRDHLPLPGAADLCAGDARHILADLYCRRIPDRPDRNGGEPGRSGDIAVMAGGLGVALALAAHRRGGRWCRGRDRFPAEHPAPVFRFGLARGHGPHGAPPFWSTA